MKPEEYELEECEEVVNTDPRRKLRGPLARTTDGQTGRTSCPYAAGGGGASSELLLALLLGPLALLPARRRYFELSAKR